MIKTAALAHIPALVALEEACFTTDRLRPRHFKHLIQSESAQVYVYFKHGNITASAVILFRKNSKAARLYSIAVDPMHRGEGIAKKLYLKLESYLLKHGFKEFRLEVRIDNHPAISFYQKSGFEIIERLPDYYEDGTEALRMRKHLNSKLTGGKYA